jgi:hypothetical protein
LLEREQWSALMIRVCPNCEAKLETKRRQRALRSVTGLRHLVAVDAASLVRPFFMSSCQKRTPPGTEQSASTLTRPARSASAPNHIAAGEPFTPAAQTTFPGLDPLSPHDDSFGVHVLHRGPGADFNPQLRELGGGGGGKRLGELGQNAGTRLHEDQFERRGVEAPELLGQGLPRTNAE